MKGYNLMLLLVSLSLVPTQKGEARLFNQDNNSSGSSSSSTSQPQYTSSTSSGSQSNFPVAQVQTIATCYSNAKTLSDMLKCQKTLLSCIKGGASSLQCMAYSSSGQPPLLPPPTPSQQSVVDPSSSNNNNRRENNNNPISQTIVGPVGPVGVGDNQAFKTMTGNRSAGGILGSRRASESGDGATGGILGSGRGSEFRETGESNRPGRPQGTAESEKSGGGLGAER